MAVACTFDQWQKDVFFPAAEAVQESADIMQSTYRMWMRERAQKSQSEILEELYRELRTALGTAKWQLEEFERAIKATHRTCSSEDDRAARHSHFVAAIENQILQVEKDLRDFLMEEKNQPLRWVQLNDEDCNDLAAFLSAAPRNEVRVADNGSPTKEAGSLVNANGSSDNDSKCGSGLEVKEKVTNQACNGRELAGGQRRTWSSPDIGSWKIVISDEGSTGKSPKNKFQELPRSVNHYGLVKNNGGASKPRWSRRRVQADIAKRVISSYLDLRIISRFTQGRNASSQVNDTPSSSCEDGLGEFSSQRTSGTIAGFKHPLCWLQHKSLRITLLFILAVFLIVPFAFHTR